MRLFAVAALLAALTPLAGFADHCEGERGAVILISMPAPPGGIPGAYPPAAYTPKGLACAEVGEDPNGNYIVPGSTVLMVRYTEDLKVGRLEAHLKGLGIDKTVQLVRGETTIGAASGAALGQTFVYSGPWVDLDPSKTGTITVTVMLPDGSAGDEFRTVA